MKQTLNNYISYLLTHIINDVENFNHWWMLFIVPAIVWFMIIIFKYFLLTIPVWLPLLLITNAISSLFRRSEWTRDDAEFAFEKGVHEGKLREHYKDSDKFSPSGLEFYLVKYKVKKKNNVDNWYYMFSVSVWANFLCIL